MNEKSEKAGALPIGASQIKDAREKFEQYRKYKQDYDNEIRENEEWWKLNHWKYLRRKKAGKNDVQPTSAWTFNSVINKHADMMDCIPMPLVLPRERTDEDAARTLTSILPVINERCGFEKVYSDNSFCKIKNGLAAYSVIWKDDDGLGDVSVEKVDVLNLFWEPNCTDIQASSNVFLVNLADVDKLTREYPQLEGKIGGEDVPVVRYESQDEGDGGGKCAVIDWYYKKDGRVHFCKFCEEEILFASENEKEYADGFYAHGMYPFVLDAMYPLEGTLFGFGVIAVCRDPQMYIDKIDGAVLENLKWQAKPRWFVSDSAGVNADDYENLDKSIVNFRGEFSENRIIQIKTDDVSGMIYNWKQSKIDELKETSSNRDVSQGSTSSGVTSGAAIATLQEAGNKTSRDIIAGSFRAFSEIVKLEIELIRQFYTENRVFRITGADGMTDEFIDFSNKAIAPDFNNKEPIFDLKIKAQKKSPFSQTAMNETAMNLYSAGFFTPDNAQAAMVALEMMDFEGIDAVRRRVSEGATLYNQIQQLQAQMAQMAQTIKILTGEEEQPVAASGRDMRVKVQRDTASAGISSENPVAEARSNAQELAANGYSRKLIERARPDVG